MIEGADVASSDRDDRHQDGRQDEALRTVAAVVASRGLEAPAMLLLEVARPLHLLVEQAFLVTHPILSPVFGQRLLFWANLFADPHAIERLQQAILAGEAGARRAGPAKCCAARQGRASG